jgi:spiro-SPASM protein
MDAVQQLKALFPAAAVYVQAVRMSAPEGIEDDIENFYRYWKAEGLNVIIQKYDNFCGLLPSIRAGDLSPLERQPCWHLMRDFHILLDGTVPICAEDLRALRGSQGIGNALTQSLQEIWECGQNVYIEHCLRNYTGRCVNCDEYYTFNL